MNIGQEYKLQGADAERQTIIPLTNTPNRAIFLWPSNFATPFVSWSYQIIPDTNKIDCHWGKYYRTIQEAVNDNDK